MSGREVLRSFLFDEGKELKNIKFFPGTGRGITQDQMAFEAAKALKKAFSNGLIDSPPETGVDKINLA